MGAWLFQGNEKKFPVNRYLRERHHQSREIQWNVGEHWQPVEVGDRAFIWRAEGGKPGTGGVIAVGHVSREPVREPDELPRDWFDQNDPRVTDDILWRVRIQLAELRLEHNDGMLRRVDLKADAALEDMLILKMPRRTVYPVDARHERALLARWHSATP